MNTDDSPCDDCKSVRHARARRTNPLFYHARAVTLERLRIGGECAGGDRLPELREQREVVVQVMDGIEPRAEDLVDALQMMQVRATEAATGVAGAARVKRVRVCAMAGIADLDVPVTREQPAIARVAGGQHAVEHVDTVTHCLDDVL